MRKDCWLAGDGPLVPFAGLFRDELVKAGHPPGSLKHYFVLMGQLDRWLRANRLDVEDLSDEAASRFLESRRATGQRRVPTIASLAPLQQCLRTSGVIAPPPEAERTATEQLLEDYRRHLVADRGLAATTIRRYLGFARRFLKARAARTGFETGSEALTSREVNTFMLAAAARLTVESAKREAADLRALLRYLYVAGFVKTDLGTAMPPVAVWRGRALPPTLPAADVDALVASCDASTRSGLRDRAVLTLMARLGLRAGEVVALELGDVDWRAGELAVRGKARRSDRLPLTAEVGAALADYLTEGRPPCVTRRLLVTLYAPARPIAPSTITSVVYKACRKARLPEVGAHRLRHALATEMLRQGGDLLEIAQVLRQSDLGTTAGYAKVDRAALRAVARRWPGAVA